MANVFIGSSSEALPVAQVIAEVLRDLGASTTGWWYADAFRPGESIAGGIERLARSHDAALLVATADDKTTVRGEVKAQPRDNLIFEAGFFAARYGRNRAPIARVGSPKLPTDLDGIVHLRLPSPAGGRLTHYHEDIRTALRAWLMALDAADGDGLPAGPRSELVPYLRDEPLWRLAASDDLIRKCDKGDLVRFIAVTGYSLFARPPRQAEPRIFVEALKHNVRFRGVVMNPSSMQANLRSSVETPHVPRTERLLNKDAKSMRQWLVRGYREHISDQQRKKLVVKRSDDLISFGLLMFEEVAFIEPLHLGKMDKLDHLCGFSIIRAPKGSHDYEIVRRHFELLFKRGKVVT